MNGIERKAFQMKMLQLLKEGGIKYKATLSVTTDGSAYEIDREDSVPIIPTDDLINPVRDLKEKLLTTCHMLKAKTVVESFEFHAKKDQKEAIGKTVDFIMEKTTVTGIHLSGQDQNAGVIISGKIKADNGSNIAVNSPRLRFTSKVYGWEEDLEAEIDHIEDELYEYLFNNKKAQLDIFSDEEQSSPMLKEETDQDALNDRREEAEAKEK